jgi:hypothetical protein
MRGTWEHSSPKSLNVYVPKKLWTTTSGRNILTFCGGLGYTRLFVRRPRNKRRSQKLASTRSRFLIDSAPRKFDIWKTNKRKRRGRQVPKTELRSVSKIPEDPLDSQPMWGPWRRLKTST